MQTLTSLALAEKLNYRFAKGGVWFMPFSPAHATRINTDQEEVLVHNADVSTLLTQQSQMGPAVTGFVALKPVVAFGFVSIWDGVAEAWMIADNGARERPLTMTKVGIHVMDITKISMGLHRLQITVRTTDIRALRWAGAIGFGAESVLHKYGPDGVDYLMMTR